MIFLRIWPESSDDVDPSSTGGWRLMSSEHIVALEPHPDFADRTIVWVGSGPEDNHRRWQTYGTPDEVARRLGDV